MVIKNLPVSAGSVRDTSSIPGLGRFPGGGHGNPLQYSCLENHMDERTWQAILHRVAKSWTQLKRLTMQTCMYSIVIQYFYAVYFIKCYYKIMAIISCALQCVFIAYLFCT